MTQTTDPTPALNDRKNLVPGRACGECTACCEVLAIEAPTLRKPAGILCRHCSGHNCQIYDQRPDPCRAFYCLWRELAALSDEHRPDQLGVVFRVIQSNAPINLLRNLYVVGVPLQRFPDYGAPAMRATLDILRRRRVPVWLHFGDLLKCVHPTPKLQDLLLTGAEPEDECVAAELAAWKKALSPKIDA